MNRAPVRLEAGAASAGWCRGRWTTFLAHREEVVGLGIEGDRARAIHRVKILLDFESSRALLLDHG